jgi:BASS family bile acid:Na+ symporter
MTGIARTAAIILAITLGALLPAAHVFCWGIRWLVMAMLFLVFLQTRLDRRSIHRRHLVLLGANLGMAFAGWGVGWLIGGRDAALAAFFSGVAPTAIAAPVIISFLHGRVEFVVASFLLTNIAIAALLPILMPVVLGHPTPEAFVQVSGTVGLVVFLPMITAWAVRALYAPAAQWPVRTRNLSFSLWVTSMFLITANASDFVRQHAEIPRLQLGQIALASLLVCAANFTLGRLIGGREFPREASQSLGQKNTTFTIYLALAYASPLVALGPTCYVIWHNLWNSWQLHRAAPRETRDLT